MGLATLAACDRDDTDAHATAPAIELVQGQAKCPPQDDRPLAAPGAFDVALGAEGPLLVWSDGAAVLVQSMARDGTRRGVPIRMSGVSSRVVEVAAAAVGDRLGVAWVVERDGSHDAFVASGTERAPERMRVEPLGRVAITDAARGRVLIAAADDGEMQVTWRNERSPCKAQTGACDHYSRRAVGARGADDDIVIAREMREPCTVMLVGSLWSAGAWYEAACHRAPDPLAVLFSLRPAISYAEATEPLPGCEPLGLSKHDDGMALWAQCADGLAVAARTGTNERARVLRHVAQAVRCEAGRPVLVAAAQGSELLMPLRAPIDAIGAALASTVTGVRAVWTGTHVVMAVADAGRLRTGSLSCVDAEVVRCALDRRP